MILKRYSYYNLSLTLAALTCSIYLMGCTRADGQTNQAPKPTPPTSQAKESTPKVCYINNEEFMRMFQGVGMAETMRSTTFIGIAGDYALLKVWEKGVLFSNTTTLYITNVSKFTDEQKEIMSAIKR